MRRLRLGAHMSIAGGLHKALRRGEEAGCDTIQIFNKSANQWRAKPLKSEDIEAFKLAKKNSEISPVISHDSYLINLASPDKQALEKSRQAFLVEMQRCEVLEIPYLVMHPGSHLGSGVESGLSQIARSFDWLHDQTDGFSLEVLIETTAGQGTNLGFTFGQIRDIFDKTEQNQRLGVCLDTCHVFTAGYDISTRQGYERMWAEFDDQIGLANLKAIHVNDSKKDLSSRVDRHDHIGMGKIGLEAFRLLVNDARLQLIPMILETPKGEDNVADIENLAVLRGLISKNA